MILFTAPIFSLIGGFVLGYLRGFQRSRFGWRANRFAPLIFIVPAAMAYAQDRIDVLIILVAGIATSYIFLMLGIILGGLFGQRTGRLRSWKT
jgi:hypothetical protein